MHEQLKQLQEMTSRLEKLSKEIKERDIKLPNNWFWHRDTIKVIRQFHDVLEAELHKDEESLKKLNVDYELGHLLEKFEYVLHELDYCLKQIEGKHVKYDETEAVGINDNINLADSFLVSLLSKVKFFEKKYSGSDIGNKKQEFIDMGINVFRYPEYVALLLEEWSIVEEIYSITNSTDLKKGIRDIFFCLPYFNHIIFRKLSPSDLEKIRSEIIGDKSKDPIEIYQDPYFIDNLKRFKHESALAKRILDSQTKQIFREVVIFLAIVNCSNETIINLSRKLRNYEDFVKISRLLRKLYSKGLERTSFVNVLSIIPVFPEFFYSCGERFILEIYEIIKGHSSLSNWQEFINITKEHIDTFDILKSYLILYLDLVSKNKNFSYIHTYENIIKNFFPIFKKNSEEFVHLITDINSMDENAVIHTIESFSRYIHTFHEFKSAWNKILKVQKYLQKYKTHIPSSGIKEAGCYVPGEDEPLDYFFDFIKLRVSTSKALRFVTKNSEVVNNKKYFMKMIKNLKYPNLQLQILSLLVRKGDILKDSKTLIPLLKKCQKKLTKKGPASFESLFKRINGLSGFFGIYFSKLDLKYRALFLSLAYKFGRDAITFILEIYDMKWEYDCKEEDTYILFSKLMKYLYISRHNVEVNIKLVLNIYSDFVKEKLEKGIPVSQIDIKDFASHMHSLCGKNGVLGSLGKDDIVLFKDSAEKEGDLYSISSIDSNGYHLREITPGGLSKKETGPVTYSELKKFVENREWRMISKIDKKKFLILHSVNAWVTHGSYEDWGKNIIFDLKERLSLASFSISWNNSQSRTSFPDFKGFSIGIVYDKGTIYYASIEDSYSKPSDNSNNYRKVREKYHFPVQIALHSTKELNELQVQHWVPGGLYCTLETPSEDFKKLVEFCLEYKLDLYRINENNNTWEITPYKELKKEYKKAA